jgi:hypothetical protein
MRIKERVPPWPPYVTPEHGKAFDQAGLRDIVISAKRHNGAIQRIILTLRKSDGSEYQVSLTISEYLLDRAIQMIEKKKNITLYEVGELDIT